VCEIIEVYTSVTW